MTKRNITNSSHLRLVSTVLDITNESKTASSLFGPLNPNSTTWRAQEIARENRLRQLSGLLKYLEKEVEILSFRLAEACAISGIDIQDQPAEPYNSTTDTAGTDE